MLIKCSIKKKRNTRDQSVSMLIRKKRCNFIILVLSKYQRKIRMRSHNIGASKENVRRELKGYVSAAATGLS